MHNKELDFIKFRDMAIYIHEYHKNREQSKKLTEKGACIKLIA